MREDLAPDPRAHAEPGERAGGGRAHHPRVRRRRLPDPGLLRLLRRVRAAAALPLDDDGPDDARRRRATPCSITRARARCTPSSTTAPASWWTGRASILTNRHVAEPWWNDDGRRAPGDARLHAALHRLPRVLPPADGAFELELERHSETVDLALLRVDLRGRARSPCCPSTAAATGAVAGQPVVVVGYPAGLEAILAKADGTVVKEHPGAHGTSSERVTEALGQQGLIRPSTTQGHIGDVTEDDIVFDAPTTQGGSGGPVFNKQRRGDRGRVRGALEVRRQLLRRPHRLRARASLKPPRATRNEAASARAPARPRAGAPLRPGRGRLPLPRPGLPGGGGLRRGLPREDRAAVPAGRAAHRVGAPAHREAADRDRRLGLRLRRPGPGGSCPRSPASRSRPSSSCSPGASSPRERAALLATVLLLADGVYLVQSRIAMTNIFAVLFQVAAALLLLRAALAERLPAARMVAAGLAPGPRPLHALDQPLGLGLPGPRAARRCAGGACSARASWPARGPRLRAPPRRDLRAELPSCRWQLRHGPSPTRSVLADVSGRAALGRAGRGLAATTPTSTPRIPTSAPGTRGRGSTGRPGTTSSRTDDDGPRASSPSATPRSGGSRCRSRSGRSSRASRARDPRRLFSGARLLLPVPALGHLAAHAQLQPLPLRGHPLRVPEPGPAPRPRLGRPRRSPRARLRGPRRRPLRCSSFPS